MAGVAGGRGLAPGTANRAFQGRDAMVPARQPAGAGVDDPWICHRPGAQCPVPGAGKRREPELRRGRPGGLHPGPGASRSGSDAGWRADHDGRC